MTDETHGSEPDQQRPASGGRTSTFFRQLRQVPGKLAERRREHRFRVDEPAPAPRTDPEVTQTSQPETDDEPPTRTVALPESTGAGRFFSHPVQTGFLATIGVLLAMALYWIVSTNYSLLIWILAAVFISLGLDPIVRKVVSWGAPRAVGVLAAVAVLLTVFGLLAWILIPTVVDQTTTFISRIPSLVNEFLSSDVFQRLDEEFDISASATQELNDFVSDTNNLTHVAGGIFGVGTAIVNTGFSVLIVVVLSLYFLVSLPSIKYWLYRLAPASRRTRIEMLSEKITSSVGNYLIGQTIVATLNGLVAFIALSIVGVPFTALLATFAGMMAFIPLVGAVTGGITITLILLINDWHVAVIFAIIYFIYLQVEAYVVSPRVMSAAVSVPGSIVVIAVIAGGSLLGVLGALIAIPTAAAILTIVKEVIVPHQDTK